MPSTLYSLVAIAATAAVLAGYVIRGVVRDIAGKAWRETAEALNTRLDELGEEVKQLKEERIADKRIISRLTIERDSLKGRVRKLAQRITELERRLHQAGIADDHILVDPTGTLFP